MCRAVLDKRLHTFPSLGNVFVIQLPEIQLEDGWDPMIKIKLNNFSCFALCDVGASTSVMPKTMYDMLDLKPFDPCSFGVRLVDSSLKKPFGRIDDVLIIVKYNYVPVDF